MNIFVVEMALFACLLFSPKEQQSRADLSEWLWPFFLGEREMFLLGLDTTKETLRSNKTNFFRLLSELRYRDSHAVLPWTAKVQPHSRSEDVRQALPTRVKNVLESCLHLR